MPEDNIIQLNPSTWCPETQSKNGKEKLAHFKSNVIVWKNKETIWFGCG